MLSVSSLCGSAALIKRSVESQIRVRMSEILILSKYLVKG